MDFVSNLDIKIFADGAGLSNILKLNGHPLVSGFTTNPSLMASAGVKDYEAFAKEVLREIRDKPVSFEVFADDPCEMVRQARIIDSWGKNVYVKIPITNTKGQSTAPTITFLTSLGIKLNVTAIMTRTQVRTAYAALKDTPGAIISVFAGRIADAGHDPIEVMLDARNIITHDSGVELLWASTREVYNIVQASQCGCDIITVMHNLFPKLETMGKDLDQFSLETVQMFYRDGQQSGYVI